MIISMEICTNGSTFKDILHIGHRKHNIVIVQFSFVKEGGCNDNELDTAETSLIN